MAIYALASLALVAASSSVALLQESFSRGSPEGSKWVSFGDLEGANLVKVTILEARSFQGFPWAPKRSHLGSLLGRVGVTLGLLCVTLG